MWSFLENLTSKGRSKQTTGNADLRSQFVDQFAGTDYADIAAANFNRLGDYKYNWFDHLGDFFGFETAADKFRVNTLSGLRDSTSQMLNQLREEEYNESHSSPAYQAHLLREAGLNPDLQNISSPALSAAEGSEFPSESPVSGNSLNEIGSVSNMLFGVLEKSFGLADLIQNFQSKAISLDNQSLGAISGSDDFLVNFLINRIGPDMFDADGNFDFSNKSKLLDAQFAALLSNNSFSSRQRKRLWQSYNQVMSSNFNRKMYDSWKSSAESQKSAGVAQKSRYYQGGVVSGNDTSSVVMPFIDALAKLYDISEESGVQSSIDTNLATSSQAKRSSQDDDITRRINSVMSDLIGSLYDVANSDRKGSVWAQAALMLIYLVRSGSLTSFIR